ncbi:MAG: hypothetical protein AMJ64_06840 [Betaproteobacteria bacterium SG8_39]|nr:MAG: hypothetical protein AMJ64_06840 [Betaproteobacteria bacterium SG8_39]
MLRLEPLFRATITLAPPQELGDAPLGRRRIIPITGGSIAGTRLKGTVLPGGADWQIVRADGVADLDARYTVLSDDGALIYVSNRGLRHGPPEVLAQLARGEDVDADRYYMRTQPWFETGDARYAWLNRTICVGTGARRADAVELEFFEVL